MIIIPYLVFGESHFFDGLWTSRVYIYHELKPNVGPHAMHGAYGMVKGVFLVDPLSTPFRNRN